MSGSNLMWGWASDVNGYNSGRVQGGTWSVYGAGALGSMSSPTPGSIFTGSSVTLS